MDEIVIPNGWRDRLQDLGVSRRDAWVLTAVALGATLVAFLLWGRGGEAHVAPPARSTPALPASPLPSELLVHVAGAVRAPGLYEVAEGSRVADALEAAGGPSRNADLDALNLASVVSDAMKIDVPMRGQTPSGAAPMAPSTAETSVLVDLNAADAAQLETLPGVGPVTAAAILSHRDDIGAFSAVEELLDVDGIGPATLEEIRPHVTV